MTMKMVIKFCNDVIEDDDNGVDDYEDDDNHDDIDYDYNVY